MTTPSKKQGHLDGLCGMYAIVNSISELAQRTDAEDLFSRICCALPQSRWPKVLWEGTTLRDLEVMIKSLDDLLEARSITVRHPFRTTQPSSDELFWQEFEQLFRENRKNRCAIIGLEKPSLHWLVVKPKANALLFIDSDNVRPRRKIPRETIYAGKRRNNKQEYLVNRKEVILFEKMK